MYFSYYSRNRLTLSTSEDTDDEVGDKNNEKNFQCYANLAVGSYSRPCVVHKNFKMIVHVPASALPSTPLAFSNRFEKVRVSIEQALSQKLRQIAWEPVTCGGGCDVVCVVCGVVCGVIWVWRGVVCGCGVWNGMWSDMGVVWVVCGGVSTCFYCTKPAASIPTTYSK